MNLPGASLLNEEPSFVIGAVTSILGLLAAFGLALNQVQNAAIVAAVTSVVAMVQALVTRSQVHPVKGKAKLAAVAGDATVIAAAVEALTKALGTFVEPMPDAVGPIPANPVHALVVGSRAGGVPATPVGGAPPAEVASPSTPAGGS